MARMQPEIFWRIFTGRTACSAALFVVRSSGLRQTGSTTIAKLIVQSVNLVNTGRKAGKVPTVQIDVCYEVEIVDRYADFIQFVLDDVAARRRIEEQVRAAV